MSVVSPDVQQIYSDMPGALPADFDAATDISVQSIVARIDGSGAAGAFLPTLSVYSQDGKLIARVPSDITYVVGDTGVVTWSPFLARSLRRTPGVILQTYAGNHTAADFAFDSGVFVASGFPTNSTFTKLSNTSLLDIEMLADFTTNTLAPNVMFCGVFIDGSNEATVGAHVSIASVFLTCTVVGRRGAGGSSGAPWAAGAHTIEVKVAHLVGGTNSTLRSSTSVELTIEEYEP